MRLLAALVLVIGFAGAAAADAARGAAVIDSWRGWAEARAITKGQIVVLRKGEPVARGAVGGASGPVDLASLSKAVTAACLMDLVAEGRAAWDDPLGRWVEAEGPLADVTLGQLLTHSGGVWPDETQGWMETLRGPGQAAYAEVIRRVEARPLSRQGRYAYNNENYGALGAAIEAIAGAPYTEVCARDGLTPSPTYGRFAAWGGWRGSLEAYGRFHWAAFADVDFEDLPVTLAFGDVVSYGPGLTWRAFRGGANSWHFGALCFRGGDNFFTHAVLYVDGLGVVSHVEGCPQDDWFLSLDAAITEGAFK